MKIEKNSSLSLNQLKGALLTNEHGAEFRIHDFFVMLDDATKVLVSIKEYDDEGNLEDETCGVYLSSIKDWTIQLQGGN
tara:strand:- start:145 stop:381 length:237 start_codon:yes stop_codon:yes gene_type:complete